jgi:hypothetical protein
LFPQVKPPLRTLDVVTPHFQCITYAIIPPQNKIDKGTSNVRIGGVLSQVQDGQERVIAYYSKTLNKAKRNYCITQHELLAIIRILEHFPKYLTGKSSTCAPTTLY